VKNPGAVPGGSSGRVFRIVGYTVIRPIGNGKLGSLTRNVSIFI
jgi:hypothetical protein